MSAARAPVFPVPVHKIVALNEHLIAGIANEKLPQYRFIYVVDLRTGVCTRLENSQGVFELVKLTNQQFACVTLESIPAVVKPVAPSRAASLYDVKAVDVATAAAPRRPSVFESTASGKGKQLKTYYSEGARTVKDSAQLLGPRLSENELACFLQVWDTQSLAQRSKRELFPNNWRPSGIEVFALKVFADNQHIVGLVSYPNSRLVKEKNLGTYRPLATSIFITDIQSGVSQVYKPLPQIRNLTVLPDNRLAAITFLDGIYIYPVDFQRGSWLSVHKYHLLDKKLSSLLGMVVSLDGKYFATYDSHGNFIVWDVGADLRLTLSRQLEGISFDFDRAPRLLVNGLILYLKINEIKITFPDTFCDLHEREVDSDEEDLDTDSRPLALIPVSSDTLIYMRQDFSLAYFGNSNSIKYPERLIIETEAHKWMPGLDKEKLAIISSYACAPLFFAPRVELVQPSIDLLAEIQSVIDELKSQLKIFAGMILNLQQPVPKTELAKRARNKALNDAKEKYAEICMIKDALELLKGLIQDNPRQSILEFLKRVDQRYPEASKKSPDIFDIVRQQALIRDRRHSDAGVGHVAVPVLTRRGSMSSLK